MRRKEWIKKYLAVVAIWNSMGIVFTWKYISSVFNYFYKYVDYNSDLFIENLYFWRRCLPISLLIICLHTYVYLLFIITDVPQVGENMQRKPIWKAIILLEWWVRYRLWLLLWPSLSLLSFFLHEFECYLSFSTKYINKTKKTHIYITYLYYSPQCTHSGDIDGQASFMRWRHFEDPLKKI